MIPKKQDRKERKVEAESKTKKMHIFVPLIAVLMLICVVTIILVVGAHSVRPTETAELNKEVEQKEEHISAATDIAATNVGTSSNVLATFTAETGEIEIYSKNINSPGTINKSNWNTFLKKIINTNGNNLGAVKSITIINSVYAPKDSSNLFSPIISDVNYTFDNVVTIDLRRLMIGNVTNMSSMFRGCSSLVSISLPDANDLTDCENIFYGCSSLESIDLSEWECTEKVDMSWAFVGCSSLTEIMFPTYMTGRLSVSNMDFEGCSSLKNVQFRYCYLDQGNHISEIAFENLSFVNCELHDLGDLELGTMKNLRTLDLTGLTNTTVKLSDPNTTWSDYPEIIKRYVWPRLFGEGNFPK